MSKNSRNYAKAVYGFDAVVRRVPHDRWGAASPCEGWTAGDVVAHAAGVMSAVAQMARTGEMAMPATPEAGDDPTAVWNASRDDVLEAIDDPDALARDGAYWFGTMTIDDLLAFTVWDPLGHAWDVATAVGLEPHTSDEVAVDAIPTIEANAGVLRAMKLMGDPVDVPDDAPPMSRFLGLIGREPSPT